VAGEHDGLQVNTDSLNAHANSVDATATVVDRAGSAGEHVRLGAPAYGLLCQSVPTLIGPIQQTAVAALRASFSALRSSAGLLRQTAALYQTCDESSAEMLGGLNPERNQ
jgi:hypothetical protein